MLELDASLSKAMQAASASDGGHCAPLATHAFSRGGEIVGAVSVFAPLVTFWAHSSKASHRESIEMVNLAHDKADAHPGHYLTACSPQSPFHPLMPRLGYRPLGNVDVFLRTR